MESHDTPRKGVLWAKCYNISDQSIEMAVTRTDESSADMILINLFSKHIRPTVLRYNNDSKVGIRW